MSLNIIKLLSSLFCPLVFSGTTYLKTIEEFNPDKNQWCLCGSMNYRRLGGGVGVVRMTQHDNYYR